MTCEIMAEHVRIDVFQFGSEAQCRGAKYFFNGIGCFCAGDEFGESPGISKGDDSSLVYSLRVKNALRKW